MAATSTAAVLSMKLLINKNTQHVLFAEASKEVVDFFFSLLALPVATVAKLVGKDVMMGCVGNLYASVDKLDSAYVQHGATKDALLCPTVISSAASANSSLLGLPAKTLYTCTNTRTYITDTHGKACPTCSNQMTTPVKYLQSAGPDGSGQAVVPEAGQTEGFVQGIVTYMVMDDLTVMPMSIISCFTILKDLRDLEERTVQLDCSKGLAILKASLQSKTVLTDVFLTSNKTVPTESSTSSSSHHQEEAHDNKTVNVVRRKGR